MSGSLRFVNLAGRCSIGAGVLALAALVAVLVGEVSLGEEWITSTAAHLAGWASFLASCLLVVGVSGLLVRYVDVLSDAARGAAALLLFATAVTAGAMATLALVVTSLAERVPEIVADPPAAVPPTFIVSGLVSGVCALVVAVSLRRSNAASSLATTLLIAGAVVSMAPLPARFFLLAFGVGVLLLSSGAHAAPVVLVPGGQADPVEVAQQGERDAS